MEIVAAVDTNCTVNRKRELKHTQQKKLIEGWAKNRSKEAYFYNYHSNTNYTNSYKQTITPQAKQ